MSSSLTVVTAVNEKYLLPLAVALRTLVKHLDGSRIDVRLLTSGLSIPSRQWLDTAIGELPGSLSEVIVDKSHFGGLKVNKHVSVETYFRIVAPHYLSDVQRALYIDADVIVRRSVTDLYNSPFEGAHLLAVPHAGRRSAFFSSESGVPAYRALGIPGHTRTFNAGVMLLDLEQWRQTATASAVLSYLRQHSAHVLWWDQDGLNAILHSKWKALPPKWNVLSHHAQEFILDGPDTVIDPGSYAEAVQDPWIVHYSSSNKPWDATYAGPFLDHWQAAVATLGNAPSALCSAAML